MRQRNDVALELEVPFFFSFVCVSRKRQSSLVRMNNGGISAVMFLLPNLQTLKPPTPTSRKLSSSTQKTSSCELFGVLFRVMRVCVVTCTRRCVHLRVCITQVRAFARLVVSTGKPTLALKRIQMHHFQRNDRSRLQSRR